MKISSPAFENNGMIPSEYTCDGSYISPPLVFSEIPKGARSLAIIMDDPDAPMGIFTHWIVWHISSNKTQFVKGEKTSFPQGRPRHPRPGRGAFPRGAHPRRIHRRRRPSLRGHHPPPLRRRGGGRL